MSARLPLGDDGSRLGRRLARQLRLSALALLWERLWPALWPAAATAGVFSVVTLLGLWEVVPWGWLHAALLLAFAGILAAALWRARGAWRRPAFAAAMRRLESESGLEHRPLSAFLDSPAGGADDPGRDALWRAHRGRAARALGRLRVSWPRPALAARDPWALRALLLLVLAVLPGLRRRRYRRPLCVRIRLRAWPGRGRAGAPDGMGGPAGPYRPRADLPHSGRRNRAGRARARWRTRSGRRQRAQRPGSRAATGRPRSPPPCRKGIRQPSMRRARGTTRYATRSSPTWRRASSSRGGTSAPGASPSSPTAIRPWPSPTRASDPPRRAAPRL